MKPIYDYDATSLYPLNVEKLHISKFKNYLILMKYQSYLH